MELWGLVSCREKKEFYRNHKAVFCDFILLLLVNLKIQKGLEFYFFVFLLQNIYDDIAMIEKSPTEMNTSSWLFHLAAKKQIRYK